MSKLGAGFALVAIGAVVLLDGITFVRGPSAVRRSRLFPTGTAGVLLGPSVILIGLLVFLPDRSAWTDPLKAALFSAGALLGLPGLLLFLTGRSVWRPAWDPGPCLWRRWRARRSHRLE